MQGVSSIEMDIAGSGESLRRYASLSSLASGVIGLVGFAFLLAFFALEAPSLMQSSDLTRPTFFGVLSNVSGILQMLLLIPAAIVLAQPLADQGSAQNRGLRRLTLFLGVAGILVMSVTTTLTTLRIGVVGQMATVSIIALGAVGLWLLISNYLGRADKTLKPGLAWPGTAVGAGLTVMAISVLAAGGPSITQNPSTVSVNFVVLAGIAAGTLALQLGLPVWAILLGRQLRRQLWMMRTIQTGTPGTREVLK